MKEAVIRVLGAADRPLRAREIHGIAQKLAGPPLSWNTVKDCLQKSARRPDSPVERVSRGRYRHRSRSRRVVRHESASSDSHPDRGLVTRASPCESPTLRTVT